MAGRVVGRWWNSRWGRWSRKDIWLTALPDGRVEVRWRGGGFTVDGVAVAVDLPAAQRAADLLREHGDPYDRWRDLTDLYR